MEIKTDASYLKNTGCSDVYTESQTEYVLPDYLGDMRKILFTSATLRPSGRFAGGETVEFSGVVVYNVVYLDSEGELSSVEFSSDYDYSVKCHGDNYNDSIADTRVSSYAVRLVGPRKISAKASLVSNVCLIESCSLSVSGSAFSDGCSPEVNMGSASLRQSRVSSVSEREYAEAVARLDGAIADEVRVVYSSVETTVDEISAEDDSVSLKGRLCMRAVIRNFDERAFTAEKQVTFEERVEFAEAGRLDKFIPKLSVTSVKSSVNADEGGCEVVMSGIVELCVMGEGNQSVDLILDGYLKDAPTEAVYEDMSYSTLTDVLSVRESHTAKISRADLEAEGLTDVIFISSVPKIESVECEDGRVTVRGEVRYSGVASELVGDKSSYTSLRFSAPFELFGRLEGKKTDNLRIEAEVKSHGAAASLEPDGICATCTLECSAVALEDASVRVLSSLTRKEGESYDRSGSVVTVYYPTAGDTLFSVAKRYRTSSLKVARDNDITEAVLAADNKSGSLSDVKRLIIF